MGFGRGYYDRYLERHPDCLAMGIAYGLQVTEQIPTEELDIPVRYLATEEGDLRVRDTGRIRTVIPKQKSGVFV